MAANLSLEGLPTELFSDIATAFPLHAAPSALLSLTLVNHAFYEVFHPILYSHVILRNENDTQHTIVKILQKPELGQYIRGLHIMSDLSRKTRHGSGIDPLFFNAIKGLDKLVSNGLLHNLGALSLHLLMGWRSYQPKGYGMLPAEFWSKLAKNCPRIKSVVLSGLEDISLSPWILQSGIYEFREFKHLEKIGLSFFPSQSESEGLKIMSQNFYNLSSSLHTLSLDFMFSRSGQPAPAPISSLHFPNLRSLTLSSFQFNDSSETMSFWNCHPNLERLDISSGMGSSSWFADTIPVGTLPALKYLEVNYKDVQKLAPILYQLLRLCIWKSSGTDVPRLLREVIPDGLPRLKSLEIQMLLLQSGTSNSPEFRTGLINYIQTISKSTPNLEEIGLHSKIMNAEVFFDILCDDDAISGFEHLERIYVSYHDGDNFYSETDRRRFFDGAFKLAQKGNFRKLRSMTNFSNRYQTPYPVARIVKNDNGDLTFLDAGEGFGMEIGYESHPFPGIPGSG
ncbi:hypothetical protein CVT25_015653 [Psilocybe cyanescens]|uniref:F-box domain-containing protein n=1 Tax=Psilocybe cyanescens TaxID=93625 RepID=A0A409WHV7_PSICY|nr:hypothetical protein CVT25_015653 [Psilocybe cyanescens]